MIASRLGALPSRSRTAHLHRRDAMYEGIEEVEVLLQDFCDMEWSLDNYDVTGCEIVGVFVIGRKTSLICHRLHSRREVQIELSHEYTLFSFQYEHKPATILTYQKRDSASDVTHHTLYSIYISPIVFIVLAHFYDFARK